MWFGFKEDTLLDVNEKLKAFDSGFEEFQQERARVNIRSYKLVLCSCHFPCLLSSIFLKTFFFPLLFTFILNILLTVTGFLLFPVLPLITGITLYGTRLVTGMLVEAPSRNHLCLTSPWSSLFSHTTSCYRLTCYFYSPNLESSISPRILGFF